MYCTKIFLYSRPIYSVLRLFKEAQRLRVLDADHNEIRSLPDDIANSILEEIHLHHNLIEVLPALFISRLNKWVTQRCL